MKCFFFVFVLLIEVERCGVNEIKINTVVSQFQVEKSAKLNFGKSYKRIWFKFPKSVMNDLTERTDPWLNILIFPMMKVGGEFHINGQVSKSKIENIEIFSAIWSMWVPNVYKPVTIIADVIADDYRPENDKLITGFSGGLDGSYTAYKFKHHLNGRRVYDLEKSVFVLGFDIPLAARKDYDLAFVNAKKMTDDLGIELISVETNYRKILGKRSKWGFEFSAAISGTLGFFGKTYATTAVGNDGIPLEALQVPWGENPLTDRYLSSDTCKFIADGYEHRRTERAGFIKDWKVGLENLRVCWINPNRTKNCGACEKCVRTKLNFLVQGVIHLPCMPWDFRPDDLKDDLIKKHKIVFYEEVLIHGKEHKTLSAEMIDLLEFRISQEKMKSSALDKKGKNDELNKPKSRNKEL